MWDIHSFIGSDGDSATTVCFELMPDSDRQNRPIRTNTVNTSNPQVSCLLVRLLRFLDRRDLLVKIGITRVVHGGQRAGELSVVLEIAHKTFDAVSHVFHGHHVVEVLRASERTRDGVDAMVDVDLRKRKGEDVSVHTGVHDSAYAP